MNVFLSAALAGLLAILWVAGGVVAGTCVQPALPGFDALPLLCILAGTFILLCIVNRVGAVSYARRRFGMNAEERQQWLNGERRAVCEKDPDAVMRELGNLAVLPVSLLVLYLLLFFGMAFAVGLLILDWEFKLIAGLMIYLPVYMPILLGLRMMPPKLCREVLVPESDMPYVRALAEKAARAAGVKGEVHLQVIVDQDVSVVAFRKEYVVFLGTRTLAVASEEELYAAILREFVFYSDPRLSRQVGHYERLSELGNARPRFGTWVFDLFFSPADVYLEWVMVYYKFALSRKLDLMASERMRKEGCAAADLSMMAKNTMWAYFDHEWFFCLPEPLYAHAENPEAYELRLCDAYREAMGRRYRAWLRPAGQMLPEQNYVGATLAERSQLLGLSLGDLPSTPTFPTPDTPFGRECIRPPLLNRSVNLADYEQIRERNYRQPLAVIEEWETSDQDRPAYELSPILNAYLKLHRVKELEALCDRILETEPDFAHALYFKGQCLLGQYETVGIDCIYRAIDINKNYMQEGFAVVATYCRLMGLEEELNALLRREEAVCQAHAAEHDDAGELRPTDRLVKETELDDTLPAMLDYMALAGNGCIDRIFLVRKVISEDFFTSVFVIDFAPGADKQDMDTAYMTVFHYLDAADWQYSLFVYNRVTEAAVHKVPDSLVWERKK